MVGLQPPVKIHQSPIPKQVLSPADLKTLNQKSDLKGWRHLIGHLTIMVTSGYLWGTQQSHLWIAIPALVVYGFSFAAMFAPLHECGHRTAFESLRMNRWVEWMAGFLSFYNSDFYRRYHKWHHRYTQIPGKDPELSDPPPTNWREYLMALSALGWWISKVKSHFNVAKGDLAGCDFIAAEARADVTRSTQLQILAYAAIFLVSAALGHPSFIVVYWLLPLAVGQPILRFILLAEHTGCTNDANSFTNTRTTLTLWPLRLLMWNMPFHAEHHLYPAIPFHALPDAHTQLAPYLAHVEAGYFAVHRQLTTHL
ncbi:MAG: fatty acid desaturase family protein [Cyanobacteria bacterium P01_A01_bin.123]